MPGGATLVATGNPVFVDESSPPAEPGQPATLVQSIALPTIGSGARLALFASSTATSDGLLTRSVDGSCLAVTGYGRDLLTAGGAPNTAVGNLTSGTLTVDGPPVSRSVRPC